MQIDIDIYCICDMLKNSRLVTSTTKMIKICPLEVTHSLNHQWHHCLPDTV